MDSHLNKLSVKGNPKGVSVIICCYNSEKVISKTLEYIMRQRTDKKLDWEVILVNNASTDNTADTARQVWNQNLCKAPFKIIDEPTPGMVPARKKGAEAAGFEYILYCDDDNWLNPDYIQTAYEIMESNPQIGVLGGKGKPAFEVTQPSWLNDYLTFYACGAQGNNGEDITLKKKYVYGAGSIYRKSLLNNLFSFIAIPGRTGNNLRGGEDIMMGLVHTIAGHKVFYDERLVFKHFISKERINFRYLLKLAWHNGKANVYLKPFIDYIDGQIIIKYKMKYIKIKFMHILSNIKHNIRDIFQKKSAIRTALQITYNGSSIINMVMFHKSYKTYTNEVKVLINKIHHS